MSCFVKSPLSGNLISSLNGVWCPDFILQTKPFDVQHRVSTLLYKTDVSVCNALEFF